MASSKLWYTKRGNVIRGPFPEKQISGYILLGRITESDELSADQNNWLLISDLPELVPKELKADLSDPAAMERLVQARIKEDERRAGDRRDSNGENAEQERRIPDQGRRQNEAEDVIRRRETRTKVTDSQKPFASNQWLGAIVGIVILAIPILMWTFMSPPENVVVDCNSSPGPKINLSFCQLENSHFSSTDLSHSIFRNSNIAYSDFSESNMTGSDFSYARLTGSQLNNAVMVGAQFVGGRLDGVNLSESNLEGANLSYVILRGADLTNAVMMNADLSNADLRQANLTDTDLTGANLERAIWVDGSVCGLGSIGFCAASSAKEEIQ